MRIRVEHKTSYRYELPASNVVQYLRLSPADHDGQHVRGWRIDVDADGRLRETRDAYGNRLHLFYAEGAVTELGVTVTGEVEVEETAGLVAGAAEPLPPVAFLRQTPLTMPDAAIRALAKGARRDDALATLHALNLALYEGLAFEAGMTLTTTTAAEAFAAGHGVCQDFAQIFVSAARLLDLPARYVSGHLARDGEAAQQDAAHAWAEALVPDLGWVAFDPANGISATDRYVRVAVGLDYLEAAPVRGARRGGGHETLTVEVHAVETAAQRQMQSQS